MRHKRRQTDPDVAAVLVAGLTGIHPRHIGRYVLFADNTECGTHLTHSYCCSYHLWEWLAERALSELATLTPCSGEPL